MTTRSKMVHTCAVCGKKSKHLVLTSSNQFGSPDLDLRPPEMMRSTMNYWIQECPHCGYVAGSVDDPTSVDEMWLKSENYISTNGITFESNLARQFYKHYLIKSFENDVSSAFNAALHAAWACDDGDETENAVRCRLAALEQLEKLIAEDDENETIFVLRMDLLRRTKQFSRVIDEYSDKKFSQELLNKIRDFEIRLSEKQDAACYTVDDCS